MNELLEDLDRALRALPVSEAPVERARRDGRRLRTRRRVTLLAGAVAIAAVAAVYPALAARTVTLSPGPPLTGSGSPSPTPANGDPVITDGPAQPGAIAGDVAQGTIGGGWWQVTVRAPAADSPCFTFTYSAGSGTGDGCDSVSLWLSMPANQPAAFAGTVDGNVNAVIGQVAQDVDYFVLTFTDGQRLKLIPATVSGYRYIAWAAPNSMTVASVVAHLGNANFDSGATSIAVPFDQPGQPPQFGLWTPPGQAAPRAQAVIGRGTADGRAWSVTVYEGPWGTCFAVSAVATDCLPLGQVVTTAVLGGPGATGANPPAGSPLFGSAAPGVAVVRVTLSNRTTVDVHPVAVGNERVWATWIGKGLSPTNWTAYSAAGKKVGAGEAGSWDTSSSGL